MRILLTGVAGFIGSSLALRLLTEGHEVIGVDNFITGQRKHVHTLSTYANFSFIEHDVIHPLDIVDKFDWVMHFASPASPPKYLKYPIETLRVNSEGTRNLLEIARSTGAGFFLASTSEVYGDPLVHPQTESYWGNVNPVGPRSVYDEAKRYAEAIAVAYGKQRGVPVRIIRIFNTYGPSMDIHDGRVVTNFIRQALYGEPLTVYGNGLQTRSFQFIDDLVEGIIRLMEIRVACHEPVNLGNPIEFTVLELAQQVIELLGSKSRIVYLPLPIDDPVQRCPDIQRAKDLLGWMPQVSLEEGLVKTIQGLREVHS